MTKNRNFIERGWQVEKATARTSEEKQMARERRKAKEAQAEMELHQAKSRHAAKKLAGKQAQSYGYVHKAPANCGAYYGTTQQVTGNQGHQAVGAADTMTGTAIPTYPLGGYPTGRKY